MIKESKYLEIKPAYLQLDVLQFVLASFNDILWLFSIGGSLKVLRLPYCASSRLSTIIIVCWSHFTRYHALVILDLRVRVLSKDLGNSGVLG